MPLSEHEQRLLDEMERNLYHNDADFVATVGGRRGRPAYRSIVLGVLIAVVGLAAVIAGVALQIPVIGIVGFVVMLGGVLLTIAPTRRARGPLTAEDVLRDAPSARSSRRGLMDRLGDRWDRRQDGEQRPDER